MAKEELKAKKAFNYGGRRLKVGDQFQAPPSHAKVLRLAGNAEAYVAPVMQAETPRTTARKNPAGAANPPAAPRARVYRRRDMTPGAGAPAED
jgi:hypothetical protein